MYVVLHAGNIITLHKTYEGAEGAKMKLVEQTNMHPDDLVIRFLMVQDDNWEYFN